jgi:Ser/Thr protein kinase RdoA (MazF antagonist)
MSVELLRPRRLMLLRRLLPQNHLLHRQVAAVLGLKNIKQETRDCLSELALRLNASVCAVPKLSWTGCHGDCHGLNARIITEGPKAGQARFFDFDDGGFGYLAYDLAVHL